SAPEPAGSASSVPAPAPVAQPDPASGPRQAPRRPQPEHAPDERRRYGESVVREILNASFIEEQKVAPPAQRPEF
ncbi:MAG: DUF2242 domain-containing protein, partial [Actinomycetota bacterium]|nr:DUF2242 domain-containing protein [Actinomycetota bacterium]